MAANCLLHLSIASGTGQVASFSLDGPGLDDGSVQVARLCATPENKTVQIWTPAFNPTSHLPEFPVAHSTVDLVVRPITYRSGVHGLRAEAAPTLCKVKKRMRKQSSWTLLASHLPEAVPVIPSGSGNHLLSFKDLPAAARTASLVTLIAYKPKAHIDATEDY